MRSLVELSPSTTTVAVTTTTPSLAPNPTAALNLSPSQLRYLQTRSITVFARSPRRGKIVRNHGSSIKPTRSSATFPARFLDLYLVLPAIMVHACTLRAYRIKSVPGLPWFYGHRRRVPCRVETFLSISSDVAFAPFTICVILFYRRAFTNISRSI